MKQLLPFILIGCFAGMVYAQTQPQIDALNNRINLDLTQINSLQGEMAVANKVIQTDNNQISQLQDEISVSQQFLNMIASQSANSTTDVLPANEKTGVQWTDQSGITNATN